MHIEIQNCDAFDAILSPRMGRGNRDIIENAKSHGPIRQCMVTRWANGAKRVLQRTRHHQIDTQYNSPRGAPRCLQAMGIHRCIGIELNQPLTRRLRINFINITFAMHAQQLLALHARRFIVLQQPIEPGGNQPIFDRIQALRRFRMTRAHVMQRTRGMSNESSCHHHTIIPTHWLMRKARNKIIAIRCIRVFFNRTKCSIIRSLRLSAYALGPSFSQQLELHRNIPR